MDKEKKISQKAIIMHFDWEKFCTFAAVFKKGYFYD